MFMAAFLTFGRGVVKGGRAISVLKLVKKSFFYRVIRVFFVVLVLMCLLYFGIFKAGYNMLTDEISQSLYSKTSYLTNTLEEEIRRIQKLQYECLNDDILFYTISAFPILSKSEQVNKLLEMQNRLKILHESSTFIEEVFVYIPGMGRKISSVEGVELVRDSGQEFIYMQEKSMLSPLFYDQGAIYLGVSYPNNIVNMDTARMFTLVIRLSEAELKKELHFLSEYPDSGIKLVDCGGEYELGVGRDIDLKGVNGTKGQWLQQVTDESDRQEYTVFKINSSFLDMDLFAYVSNKTVYRNLEIYRNIFFVCLMMVMIMMAGYIYSLHIVISHPIKILVKTIERMEKGNLGVRITEKREDEFGYVYIAFNRMAESLQNQMEINYKQKLLTQQAQLRHLQSQINPHFLYNSFFTLYRMAKDEDCESIVEFSSYLSEYYRYITKSAMSDTELKNEVEHARRYAQIQAMRFKRRLSVEFEELPAVYEKITVPRLILHPLLENAFEHGLNNVEKGGILRVWYEEREGKLYIHVQDNGAGMTPTQLEALQASFRQTEGMIEDGICNIDRRLKIKFGEAFGIEICAEEGKGTVCSLILPAESRE